MSKSIRFEKLKLEALTPASRPIRKHPRDQIRALKKSAGAYGIVTPVIADEHLQLIDGHARIEVARQLGISEIPVVIVAGLSPSDVKVLQVALNKLGERAVWDPNAVRDHLAELIEAQVDLDLTGFTVPEIDNYLDLNPQPAASVEELDPRLIRDQPIVSRADDLWTLATGQRAHRLLCADFRNVDLVSKLFEGAKASVCFGDPPYNLEVKGLTRLDHDEFRMASGEMLETEFLRFLGEVGQVVNDRLLPGSIVYLCMDWRHIGALFVAIGAVGFERKNLAVWVKSNAGMGSFYRSQHELIAVFAKPGSESRNNIELGKHGRNRSNVWSYRGVNVLGPERHLLYEHPTVKPVAMVADALRDASAAGDIVFDPFLGSGTTLIAAERTKRRCFGIEIEPKYIDLAIRRWQAETGGNAVRQRDGATFDQLELAARERSQPAVTGDEDVAS